MTLTEYLTLREQEGVNPTAAMLDLKAITGAGERTVWNWHKAGKAPAYAERLMRVWTEALPEQRERWFSERG